MKTMDQNEFARQNMFGLGAENTAYARYFSGQSYLNPLTKPEDGLFLANVTFEPGCRNNWHIHHAKKGGGQLLICTAGEGWYQETGESAGVVDCRHGHYHPARSQALAWRTERQLVLPYRRRDSRRGYL